MPTVPVIDEVGPTMEHRGKALLRHIVSKSPKPIIMAGFLDFFGGV